MDNRILHIFAPLERLDIFSLGERVYFDYVGEKSGEYSIEISVDTSIIDESSYSITGNNRFVKNKNLSVMIRDYESLGVVSFTLELYFEVFVGRLRYLFPAIGLTLTRNYIDDNSLIIYFTINENSRKEYKKILQGLLLSQFEYKAYDDFDTVKNGVLEYIVNKFSKNHKDIMTVGEKDLPSIFEKLPKPEPIAIPKDDILICDTYLSSIPLELVLHGLILDGYIQTIEKFRGRFRIKINIDACIQGKPVVRPIQFDKTTGAVYLKNKYLGTLPIGRKGYKLFSVLYDNQDAPVSADAIMQICDFISNGKSAFKYIDQAIDEGLDIKLGKEFSDKFIRGKANNFTLYNTENIPLK